MIDFHAHIIPNIDDGSGSDDETNALLQEAKEVGFTKIISTSHYYINRFEVKEAERKIKLKEIEEQYKEKNTSDLELLLGSEIYITSDIVDLIKEGKASTINNTRYVLFELPFHQKVFNLKDVIFSLLENKYKPIIAHPERYKMFQENPNILIDLIDMGVLFQANYASIIGAYGIEAKKTVKKLLKNGMIHFLGSDVHRQETIYPKIPVILNKIEKITGRERLYELTTLNAEEILKDRDFEAYIPTKIKPFFSF